MSSHLYYSDYYRFVVTPTAPVTSLFLPDHEGNAGFLQRKTWSLYWILCNFNRLFYLLWPSITVICLFLIKVSFRAGDVVGTTCHISENPVIGLEGWAYPLGSLASGTWINRFVNTKSYFLFVWHSFWQILRSFICSVERYPTEDSDIFVQKAGTAAQVVRHQADFVVVRVCFFVLFCLFAFGIWIFKYLKTC